MHISSAQTFAHTPPNFRSLPPAVKTLLAANIAVFFLAWASGGQFMEIFGLVPERVIHARSLWQPITYLFVHAGALHLLFNLFALWMFGVPVEAQWDKGEFYKFYFLCGLGAAATQIAVAPSSTIPVVGASGAIYGLLVAFAMLYPDAVVYLYFFIPVKAKYVALLFGAIEFFAGASDATPGVARFAHLGGMVTGYLYLRWWWILKIRAKGAAKGIFSGPWPGLGKGPARRPPAGKPRRAAARPEGKPSSTGAEDAQAAMAEVDRILDKILVSGMDSLTDNEREIMKRYSGKLKH